MTLTFYGRYTEMMIYYHEDAKPEADALTAELREKYPELFIFQGDIMHSLAYWEGSVDVPYCGRYYISIDDISNQTGDLHKFLEEKGVVRGT